MSPSRGHDHHDCGEGAPGCIEVNLDCLSDDDLAEVGSVLSRLHDYTVLKRRAMRQRLGGNVAAACENERECDRIYAALPPWARW